MNLLTVAATGLFAGGVSCAAVQGSLLTGLITRQRDAAAIAMESRDARPAPRAGAGRSTASRPGAATSRSTKAAKGAGAAKGTKAARQHSQVKVRTLEPPKPVHQRVWLAVRAQKASLADDITPVGAFLAGKLLSHTMLGLLLGLAGSAVSLSPTVRGWLQLAAGGLVIAFGLAQLKIGPFKNLVVEPPAAWSRFVRGQARSQAAFAPAILGFFTILIPCGVTLSMEALALTSGSPWQGAAIMAVFVLATSPLLAVLGYAARKAVTAWRGRLAVATGLIVLALGVYTLNGGLTLLDSPLAAANLPQTLGLSAPPAVGTTVTLTAGQQEAVLTARPASYTPANIALTAGVPTTLVVRADNNDGCTRAFVIRGKQYVLPENGDTRIDLGALQPGTLRYRCGMGMYSGQLTITAPTTASK